MADWVMMKAIARGLQVTVAAFCSEFDGVVDINLTHLFETDL
jgi:hypothetical protein